MATFAGFATLGSAVFAVAGVVVLVLIIVFARRSRDGAERLDTDEDDVEEPADASPTGHHLPRGYAIVLGCFAMAAVLGVLGVLQRHDPSAALVGRIQALERRLNAAEVELDTLASAAASLDKRPVAAGPGTVDRQSPAPRPEATLPPPAAETPQEARESSPVPAARPPVAAEAPPLPPPAPRLERDAPPPPAPAAASPTTTGVGSEEAVAYHPAKRLQDVRKGQAKDVVFGLFGTEFANRDGTLVEIQGMRLMSIEKSPSSTRFEVGRVRLGDDRGSETSYWFLFEEGRLLTWGRPEEWRATASRYKPDLPARLEF